MPIYRQNETGSFVPFEKTELSELEKVLESWIEASPEVMLGSPLAIFGRQAVTKFGKIADLLAVDENGACVVIELKRGTAPRDVIAQTLEYTAWADSLTLDDLDEIARHYAERRSLDAAGIWDIYRLGFGSDSGQTLDEDIEGRVTFNATQRMIIVAEDFPPEMEQTLRYMRTKLGVDMSAVRFSVHRLGNDMLL